MEYFRYHRQQADLRLQSLHLSLHTVAEAQQRAYQLAGRIKWDGVFYRKDIGWRAIAREQE